MQTIGATRPALPLLLLRNDTIAMYVYQNRN
jgi:hypothetical protein